MPSLYFGILLILMACFPDNGHFHNPPKINGVNLVAPRNPIDQDKITSVNAINANWVAIVPYAFSHKNKPEIYYSGQKKWWGESREGVIKTIEYAQSLGFKVMLKPHVWVRGDGWPGEFSLESDSAWQIWESTYQKYIHTISHIADSMQVEMLCVGTEYKMAVQERPDYWKNLISSVKKKYSGKLTYAANWDNYKNIPFWDQLDFIGIDAYFPLSKDPHPSLSTLMENWQEPYGAIKTFSQKFNKPVLFTEFGYRSIDHTAAPHWEIDEKNANVNLNVQSTALQALFEKFWHEPWFVGGFLWKWFPHHERAGGNNHKGYTPQNKPAEELVRMTYGQFRGE